MLPAVIVFGVAFVLGLALPDLGLGAVADALLVALAAAGAARLASRPAPAAALPEPTMPTAPPAPAMPPQSEAAALPAASAPLLRELRHDLRGILSPALMMADRLLMTSQDPLVRRCAETMVETIERAERRLSVTEASGPDAHS